MRNRSAYMRKRDKFMRNRYAYMRNTYIYMSNISAFMRNRYIYMRNRSACFDISPLGFLVGVASISRLLKIIGLFCKRALQKRLYSAKETYDFKEPTNRSHPIHQITFDQCENKKECVFERKRGRREQIDLPAKTQGGEDS